MSASMPAAVTAAAIPAVQLRDLGPDPSAIASFTVTVAGSEAEDVVQADRAAITIVLPDTNNTLLDAEARALPMLIRASPHYYNTEAEVDRLLALVASLPRAELLMTSTP